MEIRKEAEVLYNEPLVYKDVVVGEAKIVSYYTGSNHNHLEYEIYEPFRGRGYAKKLLPKFLKNCRARNYRNLVAVIKKDNEASIRLIIYIGGVPMMDFSDDCKAYVVRL